VGHSTFGRAFTKVIAGSYSPAYGQLDWRAPHMSRIRGTVAVSGDRYAGRLPRNWNRAMVMAFPIEELEDLKAHASTIAHEEAVAYISERVVHVGTKATQGYLFERLNEEEMAIGMRIGRGPLEATPGIWLPDREAFSSVKHVRVVEAAIPVSALISEYPGMVMT